jgi:hypothetical protein
MMYIEIRQHRIVGTLDRITANSWNVIFVPGRGSAVTVNYQYVSRNSKVKRKPTEYTGSGAMFRSPFKG